MSYKFECPHHDAKEQKIPSFADADGFFTHLVKDDNFTRESSKALVYSLSEEVVSDKTYEAVLKKTKAK